MHAVIVNVTIHDRATAEVGLREQVVPAASSAPGFIAGYWMDQPSDKGKAVIVFESEDAAQTYAASPPTAGDAPVTVEDIEVAQVVANA
jgi:hypothetical protein